jgi:hypothetical protein
MYRGGGIDTVMDDGVSKALGWSFAAGKTPKLKIDRMSIFSGLPIPPLFWYTKGHE